MDEAIQKILRNLAAAEKQIRLMNVYQGIPISYQASIQGVGSGSVKVQTEKYQLVCLYRERETCLQHPELPAVVKARVLDMDIPYLRATLGEFQYLHEGVGDRRQVRVWPKEMITGGLQTVDRSDTNTGELADISADGLGIYIPENEFSPRIYRQGRKISISYRLTGTYQLPPPKKYETSYSSDPTVRFDRTQLRLSSIHTPTWQSGGRDQGSSARIVHSPELEVTGIIANLAYEANNKRYRLGIKLLADENYRIVVTQFIAQRQSEIIQEINALYKIITKDN